jgi:molybdopterin converting factor subunit 1
MKRQIKLFAAARQLAGQPLVEVELAESATVADLRRAMSQQCPALAELARHVVFAIDTEYATDDAPVPPDGELACIPPVSGG